MPPKYSSAAIEEANIEYRERISQPNATQDYRQGLLDFVRGNRETMEAGFYVKIQQLLDIANLAIDRTY